LSIEFLTELEKKVDLLIQKLEQLRCENTELKGEVEKNSGTVADIEKENRAIKKELGDLKATAQEQGEKLKAAAEKVQSLLAKIEAA
jgi:FtsZ-binding cell division protein ZapB